MQGLHNPSEKNRSRVITGSGTNNLRGIKSGPYSSSVITGKAAIPSVLKSGGRTGLTGNFHTTEVCFRTGTAGSCIDQTIVHIINGLLAEDLFLLLNIVDDQIALRIVNLCEGTFLTPDAIVGEGGIRTGHITDMHTPGLCTHCQRRKAIIGMNRSICVHILIHQGRNTKLILGKIITIAGADLIQGIGSNRIHRTDNTAENCAGVCIFIVIISGPGTIVVHQRQVLDNSRRRNRSLLKAGSVDRNRLNGRTGLQFCVCCTVPIIETGLLTNTAGHCYNITGGVINHNNSRLQLLTASGIGNLGKICVDLIHLLLHLHINGGINMVATALDLLHHQFFGRAVPDHAVLFGQGHAHVFQNGIGEPAIHIPGAILHHGNYLTAAGAVILGAITNQSTDNTLVITLLILAESHAVFKIDAILQHQFLIQGMLIFRIRQPAILMHGPQGGLFSLSVVFGVLIRIVIGGRIGNTDDTCTFGSSQALQFLTIIGFGRTSDTAATLTKVNEIQIQLQDFVLIVAFFHLDRTENLQHFTLNSNIVSSFVFRQQHIFNQLLRDTGTTGRRVTEEHSCTGFDGSDPVNTLMFKETMVLNGNGRIDHILRNVFKIRPGTAGRGENILILPNLAVIIHIVQIGVLFQIVVININICHRKNIVLQVITQNTGKHKGTDHADHQHRTRCAHGNLKAAKDNTPGNVQNSQNKIRLPVLPLRLLLFSLFFSLEHSVYLQMGSKSRLGENFFIRSASKHNIVHRL